MSELDSDVVNEISSKDFFLRISYVQIMSLNGVIKVLEKQIIEIERKNEISSQTPSKKLCIIPLCSNKPLFQTREVFYCFNKNTLHKKNHYLN